MFHKFRPRIFSNSTNWHPKWMFNNKKCIILYYYFNRTTTSQKATTTTTTTTTTATWKNMEKHGKTWKNMEKQKKTTKKIRCWRSRHLTASGPPRRFPRPLRPSGRAWPRCCWSPWPVGTWHLNYSVCCDTKKWGKTMEQNMENWEDRGKKPWKNMEKNMDIAVFREVVPSKNSQCRAIAHPHFSFPRSFFRW